MRPTSACSSRGRPIACRVTRVRIARGTMYQQNEDHRRATYTIRNEDTTPRVVIIEHPTAEGWKLVDSPAPEESSAGWHRFRVNVEPKKTAVLKVNDVLSMETRIEVTDDAAN